jgi:hypothetical protein
LREKRELKQAKKDARALERKGGDEGVPLLDADGMPVLGEDGEPILTTNGGEPALPTDGDEPDLATDAESVLATDDA